PPARVLAAMLAAVLFGALAPAAHAVDYGPLDHSGLRPAGPAPAGLRLHLQLGLKVDERGVEDAVRAGSDPASPTYGDYPSLRALAARYGAPAHARDAVASVFARSGNRAATDPTHERMSVTISVATAQRLFGTRWALYRTPSSPQRLALPVDRP